MVASGSLLKLVLSNLSLATFSSASVRENVKVVGTTMEPNFVRMEGKSAKPCPESHPYSLNHHQSCCAAALRSSSGGICDGSLLRDEDPLQCCIDAEYIACPHAVCKTNPVALEGNAFSWSSWGDWSSCSGTCISSSTSRSRTRTCVDNTGLGMTCTGSDTDVGQCDQENTVSCDCLQIDVDLTSVNGANNIRVDGRTPAHPGISDISECFRLCLAHPDCTHYTWVVSRSDCWLKTGTGTPVQNKADHISALVDCRP